MDVHHLLAKAHGLPDPGVPSDEQRAALCLADALDTVEDQARRVVAALEIIEPLLPREEAIGYVAARLRALADRLDDAT